MADLQTIEIVANQIDAIVKEKGSILGTIIRWTSKKNQMQMTGECIGATMKRNSIMLHITPDNENFGDMKVPIHLVRSVNLKKS